MSTAVIEIKNDLAYNFLQNLERMNLLRIVSRENNHKQKLSERFAGSLSNERVDELQNELNQMRNEWDRNIY